MRVKQLSHYAFIFLALCAFSACNPESVVESSGKYANGVFVLNEGTFSEAGSITWHNEASGETVQDVFGLENNGASIGLFPQNMVFANGKCYVVASGSNIVYVLNAETFKVEATIDSLAIPRYFLPVSEELAYVSQWGLDGVTGSIAKVNLLTNTVVQTIPTGPGPERMYLSDATTMVVANSGGYNPNPDSTISILNLVTFTEQERRIVADKNPIGFIKPAFGNQQPLVLCKGDWSNNADTDGWLGALSSNSSDGVSIPKFSDDLVAGDAGNTIWFAGGGAIWNYNSTGLKKAFNQTAYCFTLDASTNKVYCGDAGDFASPGKVIILDKNGAKISEFQTGNAPGEIVVR